MPKALMIQGGNTQLAASSLPRIVEEHPEEVERLGQPGTLVPVAKKVLGLKADEVAYLQAIPSALQESMRAAIYDALSNGKSVQLQYSPGYDFSLQFWDFGEAVSIHITGPYEVRGYERPSGRTTAVAKTREAKTSRGRIKTRKPVARSRRRAR